MKRLFLLICIGFSSSTIGQVTKVLIQASGLTCSMCSNSIYKSLKTISFVDRVEPNIKTSTFEITFKPGINIDFNKLRGKVEDAGYGIAKFVAAINCKNVQVRTNETVKIDNIKFQFINLKDQSLDGIKQVKIMNKGFVPLKEFRKNGLSITTPDDVYIAAI